VKIAPQQRQELDFLRDMLNNMETAVGRDQRQNYRELRTRLDNWAAKVAVIGQVKAGKSTFLNAFLHQHDFLPSDVNPWTSVVTNIRVNLPKDPATGARFEFFAESDWAEIIAGGSKIRKLTEQLLPGFDTELLRKQSEEMRERAEKRLGKHFSALLGTQHDYDFLTADLLKRYVCAGPGSDDGLDRDSLGRYAALTKVANVYMRLPEFLVPTIITDTPGVNDPFLVRDEFTCRSLDRSDVFVMVLSAHQPLTDVDIALIRILATQDSKDVLIFINRIDELDDYDAEVPRVIEDVSRRLRNAIPEIEFKMVVGSAYMADLAMRDDDEAEAAREAIDDIQLRTYLKARFGHVPEDRYDRLMLASGLSEVKAELSHVIDNGVGSKQLAQLLGDIRAELNGTQFITKRERESLQLQVESINGEVAEMAVDELQEEIDSIRKIHEELEHHVENADSQIEKVLTRAWSGLESRLIGHIESFVDAQKEVFEHGVLQASVRGAVSKPIEIDTAPLQAAMEKEVVASFERSRAGSDVSMSNCMHACRQVIRDKFEDPTENISLDGLPFDEFNSTLTLSKRTLRVDIVSERSWAFWRKPTLSVEKTIAALRAIAAEELRPPVEKLLAAFNEAQVERASAGTGRIRILLRMIEVGLTERTHRLKQDKAEMEQVARDPDLQRRMVHRLQSKMEVLERRLINLSALDSALSRSELAQAA
jgi:signal recognition particle receptor subunit beta